MKKSQRQEIFNKCNGRCAYCGWDLDSTWQVDHMISKQYWFYIDTTDPKSVNRVENLMPSCVVCNHYKRSHCVNDNYEHVGFRTFMMKFHIRLGKLPKKSMRAQTLKTREYMMRIAERYNITPDKPFSGVFYFETLKAVTP